MKKRPHFFGFILGFIWLGLISVLLWKNIQQQQYTQQQLHQFQQKNDLLNDQLVALQRADKAVKVNISPDSASQVVALDPMLLLTEQVDYIELALQQGQANLALVKLGHLHQALDEYPLSAALKQSWYQVIARDQSNIQQFVSAQQAQTLKLQQVLQKVDRDLSLALQPSQIEVAQTTTSWWQSWFKLERADQPPAQLTTRAIVLKEAQLRLVLAQSLLAKAQYALYQAEIQGIIAILAQLPDQQAQQLKAEVANLAQLEWVIVPKLATRTLLGH